jgi:hypothetical protein
MFFSKGAQQASGDWGKALSDIPEEQSYTVSLEPATLALWPLALTALTTISMFMSRALSVWVRAD